MTITPARIAELRKELGSLSSGVLPLEYKHYDRDNDGVTTVRYGGGAIAFEVPHKMQLEGQAMTMVAFANEARTLLDCADENARLRDQVALMQAVSRAFHIDEEGRGVEDAEDLIKRCQGKLTLRETNASLLGLLGEARQWVDASVVRVPSEENDQLTDLLSRIDAALKETR